MRRQGSSPVRPLPEFEDYNEFADFVKSQPKVGNYRETYLVMSSYEIGNAAPVLLLGVNDELTFFMEVFVCENSLEGLRLVNGKDVDESVQIGTLPCDTTFVTEEEITDVTNDISAILEERGFTFDEWTVVEREDVNTIRLTAKVNW